MARKQSSSFSLDPELITRLERVVAHTPGLSKSEIARRGIEAQLAILEVEVGKKQKVRLDTAVQLANSLVRS